MSRTRESCLNAKDQLNFNEKVIHNPFPRCENLSRDSSPFVDTNGGSCLSRRKKRSRPETTSPSLHCQEKKGERGKPAGLSTVTPSFFSGNSTKTQKKRGTSANKNNKVRQTLPGTKKSVHFTRRQEIKLRRSFSPL